VKPCHRWKKLERIEEEKERRRRGRREKEERKSLPKKLERERISEMGYFGAFTK
jgi:hypothetical protein